jgi:lycopene cyclase domain-containing protein
MAFTYLVMNLIFLVCIAVLFLQYLEKPTKAWWITLGVLLILTAVFDSIIIWADIVAYDPSKILGLFVGFAPMEDFFYAILAIVIVPALWNLFDPKMKRDNK